MQRAHHEFVRQLQPEDVLLGRGTGPNGRCGRDRGLGKCLWR